MVATNDTPRPANTVQLLTSDGRFQPSEPAGEYLPYLERLDENDYRRFYRDMVRVRAFDHEAANLQRQGQLGLWVPSHGQEGAQVGSAYAARPQDNIFPSYREHVIGMIRGIDPVGIMGLLRGVTHGGWDPTDPAVENFHLYTLVIGSHTLHATGYAMGVKFDGKVGTGNPEADEAVICYFGDGATSQGDVSEALVFAASYQTPQVFFLQNNQWAISVPVKTQSRTPLYLRSSGFGIPGVQIDGNDVLAAYAVTAKHLDDARGGEGPSMIEALTYRMGAHTSSDDPTKYRTDDEVRHWAERDPILRFRAFLEQQGLGQTFFDSADEEAADLAADVRRRTLELTPPPADSMFEHVYSEPHPVMEEQRRWLAEYEASFGGDV
ncbi:pyruvate dehydrogenase (acetyl-transferring) E1 component subunit alpha [Leifsonia xyli subsp. xyli]|uniref:Pyruvate dehydrogenase E1 component, alpha subunit n=2 Tax=Leifsonia xyli subsp. xyli TaxID=59736 RepID=Q6ABX7_LEIXX|nr:pyruvate dehydrogenase (acetyl-transferring) E1 component subunit alpha [Leifsonia xyli]AAT90115.1 pyruvate dehydrogenase E1 component, alpha subunit [Leifsonia xyli subsp. xyli str. CTCB07]ODA89316.1 pyruvate dehydrogenase (acetyl-transferring) E1 component subunit alpha [Leifsonia xyli subsp. xyli]